MVRGYRQQHVYEHPWDRVTCAAFRKFTDPAVTPALAHIADAHTLRRQVDPATGLLHLSRSITVRSPPLPFILRRLLPSSSLTPAGCAAVRCLERTAVDPVSREMRVAISNISLRGLIEVEEKSTYRPHADRPHEWTVFEQETSIRCRPLSALAAVAERVEHRCADKFLQNSAKGREVVERICRRLAAEATGAVLSA